MPVTPDCRRCAACCHSTLSDYVRVTGDDHARLGDRADDLVVFSGTRAFMRMENGHCAALVHDGSAWSCTVYEVRPATCRELERGSPQCEAEIERKSELVALRRHA
jgi:Fe-S-cluster containining protein